LKQALSANQWKNVPNVHFECASLIKKFYFELPPDQKVFASLTPQQLERSFSDDSYAVGIVDQLIDPAKNMYFWLVDLICQTALLHKKK